MSFCLPFLLSILCKPHGFLIFPLTLSVPTLQPRSSGSCYTYLSTCLVLCALWEPPAQKMVRNRAIWRRSASPLLALAHRLSYRVPDEMSFSVFSPVRTWNGILPHPKIVRGFWLDGGLGSKFRNVTGKIIRARMGVVEGDGDSRQTDLEGWLPRISEPGSSANGPRNFLLPGT